MTVLAMISYRLKQAHRFFVIPNETRAYIRKIRKSDRFDRQFYLGANPQLNLLYRRFPERHFALIGETQGLRPNPDFAPHDYISMNHDLATSGVRAFEHFIDIGHSESRPTQRADYLATDHSISLPVLRKKPGSSARFAVALHVYYPDLWPEFQKKLSALCIPFDLFISATDRGEQTQELFTSIRHNFPNATCFTMPNQGRDIFPFVHLVNSGLLDSYEAVCKLHTKKSPHRIDGDRWRQHLVDGLIGDSDVAQNLTYFLDDNCAAIWVADGQHYQGEKWWGSNLETAVKLLRRVEILPDARQLSFPAGSIYWLKPEIISMIKGLQLCQYDFETEQGQVDGTLAHAFERSIGYFAQVGGQKTCQTSELVTPPTSPALPKPKFTTAFYLPQFHPTQENDAWWGKGFTEWRSTVNAKPQFDGHAQPNLPSDLGFYDLRIPSAMEEQAHLAQSAGIDAFCVYHYWFDGRRILEEPLNNLIKSQDKNFPFYLCWANESWRRNWDGLSGEILIEQTYANGFEDALVASTLPYMRDHRYQRPNGESPRFVIYRPEDLPNPAANIARMREAWRTSGIGEVEIGAVRFHQPGEHKTSDEIVDFWVEMAPHGMVTANNILFSRGGPNELGLPTDHDFQGLIYSYPQLAEKSATRLGKNTIAGIMPSWDNTARRKNHAHIAYGSNPQSFARWLREVRKHRIPRSYRNELFINAWNEWAENAVLEPSQKWGSAYLHVLKQQLNTKREQPANIAQIAAE